MVKTRRVKTDAGKNLDVALDNLAGKVAKVGWFEKSKYPEPPHLPVAYVATIQEYGNSAEHIPPRPFMRPTVIQKRVEWRGVAERGAKAVLAGRATAADVMEQIGLKAAGDVRRTISQIWSPPLSPRTIAARLAKRKDKKTIGALDKPLVDTGLMLATLTNTVEDG